MIVSICNEKGGSGKSSIAINLAVYLGSIGEKVLLVDADPQQSVAVFNRLREEAGLEPAFDCAVSDLSPKKVDINELTEKYDCIIVDTGGRDSSEMRNAIVLSDLIIVPTSPTSDIDIAVVEKMIHLFDEAKKFNTKSKALITLSRATPNTFLTKKIEISKSYLRGLLKGKERVSLLKSTIYERDAFSKALSSGMGITEFVDDKHKAYQDFMSFFKELEKYASDSEI